MLLVSDRPDVAATILLVQQAAIGSLVIGGTLVVLAVRWRWATAPQRRVLAPVLVTGSVCLAVQAVGLAAAASSVRPSVGWVGAVAFAAVPVSFLLGLLRQQLDRSAVGRLVVDLGAMREGDQLDGLLRTALKDPSVQVAYWRDETAEYVDATGLPVPLPSPEENRAVTVVERRDDGSRRWCTTCRWPTTRRSCPGRPRPGSPWRTNGCTPRCAPSSMSCGPRVAGWWRPATASAAGSSATCTTGRSSGCWPSRCCWASNGAPADGVVQGLAEQARRAGAVVVGALELATGLHPAVLTDHGLAVALEGMAARAPIPVELVDLTRRAPPQAEVAAYYVISEALANAVKHAAATRVTVRVRGGGSVLEVEVVDDGVGGADARGGRPGPGRPARRAGRAAGGHQPAGGGNDGHGGDPVRVAIADDAVLLRDRLLGDAGFDVVATYGDAEALLDGLETTPVDVCVLDIKMPPTFTDEGLRAATAIRSRWPQVGALVLSQYVELGLALRCSPTEPRGSATCSRTGSPTSTSSSTPSDASARAAPPSIPRWCPSPRGGGRTTP